MVDLQLEGELEREGGEHLGSLFVHCLNLCMIWTINKAFEYWKKQFLQWAQKSSYALLSLIINQNLDTETTDDSDSEIRVKYLSKYNVLKYWQ